MPEKTINLDCCSLFLSEYPENFFSLDLADHTAAYIRFNNPETGLNCVLYFYLETAECVVVCADIEQLADYDQSIKRCGSPETLSKNELYDIFGAIGHIHVLPGMSHPSLALIQARHKGVRLSGYDEIIVQMYERRMLAKRVVAQELTPDTIMSPNRVFGQSPSDATRIAADVTFRRRAVLIQIAIRADNHNLLHEALHTTVIHETAIEFSRLLNEAVLLSIALDNRKMLIPVFRFLLEPFTDRKPNYEQLSAVIESMVMKLPCDQAAFYRVKPIFALLGQLYTDVRESRFDLGKLNYAKVRQFHAAVENHLIVFIVDILQPLDGGSSPIQTFTEKCVADLDTLTKEVPSTGFLLSAGASPYQALQVFFKSLSLQPLSRVSSAHSFFRKESGSSSNDSICAHGGSNEYLA